MSPNAKRASEAERAPKDRPAAEWRRDAGGGYRSVDGRFTVVSEGSGRWFVRDGEEPDELGQPRTTGPFATLADGKSAASEQRRQAPEESPLAKRIAEARARPKRRATAARTRVHAGKNQPPPPPRPKTWLEGLADEDPALARRGRAVVAALEAVGVPGEAAEGVVRRERDVLLKEP